MKNVVVLNGVVLSQFREARQDEKTNKMWPAKVSVDFIGGTFSGLTVLCKPEDLILGKPCVVSVEFETQSGSYINAYHQTKDSFAFFPVSVIGCSVIK